MARRKSQEEEGANWMDTYGDMITLVLTFFVLLYAMSSIDKTKYEYIVEAFSEGGGDTVDSGTDQPNPKDDSENAGVAKDNTEEAETVEFEYLYKYLKEYIEAAGLSESVSIEQSATGVYMKFKDNIFFAGDSDALLEEGKAVLEGVSGGIGPVEERILAIKVSGHTAGSTTSDANEWDLSSGRADSVINYMLSLEVCDAEKFSSSGYGKYRPVVDNDTAENRAKNRRVEIVFIRNDIDFSDPDVIKELLELEFGSDVISDSILETQAQTTESETGTDVTNEAASETVSDTASETVNE